MFNKLKVQGRFVVEVANVERGQRGISVVQRIDFDGHDAVLRSSSGQTVTVPWKAGRGRIHDLLAVAGQSLDPAVPDPLTYPGDDLSAHQQWCELLYDVGSGAETLEHMVPGLHFASIERRDAEAEIVLTDGPRRQSFTIPLDGPYHPAGINAEIGSQFGRTGEFPH